MDRIDVRPFVIGHNLIVMIVFAVHICLSITKLRCIRIIQTFYVIPYTYIIIIEVVVYVLRGLMAFVGAIKKHFLLMILASPLTMMALAWEIVMAHTFLTSEYYYGYKTDIVEEFSNQNLTKWFKLQLRWQCCGMMAPTDWTTTLSKVYSCCNNAKTCDLERAFPVGCWVMHKYMFVAGVVCCILALLTLITFLGLLLLAKDAKDGEEDEDED